MLDFNAIIESEHILLRPISATDFEEMSTLTSNPDMWHYFTADLSKADELHAWIETAIEARKNKTRLAFTAIEKETGHIIGSTSLGSISERDKRIEIGWTWIAPLFRGKRFNRRIKHMLLKHCFETCGYVRVESKTDVLNMAARTALQHTGFTEEGILRSHTQVINNRRRDTIFYSVLAEEWETIKHPDDI